MKSIACAVICLLAALSLISCSGGGSSNNNSTNSLAMKGTSGNAVNMNGTWERCEPKDLQTDSLIKAATNGSQITINVSIWDAPTTLNCQQTAIPDAVITEKATATLGAEAAATWTDDHGGTLPPGGVSLNAKATEATLVYYSAIVTLNSATWVANFNSGSGMCGKTDWAVGVPTDVLNCTAILSSTTDKDYWVVDDSSVPLKLYTQTTGTVAYEVDSVNPLVKQ